MEKNIVVIDLEKYENLIKENENLKREKDQLDQEITLLKNEREANNQKIMELIYEECRWELGQMVKNKEDNNSYYKRQIAERYNYYGITSLDYINECIDRMIKKYEEDNKEEE